MPGLRHLVKRHRNPGSASRRTALCLKYCTLDERLSKAEWPAVQAPEISSSLKFRLPLTELRASSRGDEEPRVNLSNGEAFHAERHSGAACDGARGRQGS